MKPRRDVAHVLVTQLTPENKEIKPEGSTQMIVEFQSLTEPKIDSFCTASSEEAIGVSTRKKFRSVPALLKLMEKWNNTAVQLFSKIYSSVSQTSFSGHVGVGWISRWQHFSLRFFTAFLHLNYLPSLKTLRLRLIFTSVKTSGSPPK